MYLDETNSAINSIQNEDMRSEECESRIIDDLYVLKSSLVQNKKLVKKSSSYLKTIKELTINYPNVCNNLYEWKFLEKEILFCLRTEALFLNSIQIIKTVIMHCSRIPNLYLTKKFNFFLSEKIYFYLGGEKEYRPKKGFDNSFGDSCLPESEIFKNTDATIETKSISLRCKQFTICQEVREIIDLFQLMIKNHPSVCHILYELGVFDICNSLLIIESARMFNCIFQGIYYFNQDFPKNPDHPWQKDGLFEIHRKFFDPEIIFRNKDSFIPKTLMIEYRAGLYENVYKQCTNIKAFADLSILDFINVMLFKPIIFMNDDLDLLLLEIKDPKIIRFYRRSLEIGAVPEKNYLSIFIKNLDKKEFFREISILLFYYIDIIEDGRLFTESRIRRIFESLEYLCESYCNIQLEKPKNSTDVSFLKNTDMFSGYFSEKDLASSLKRQTLDGPLIKSSFDSLKCSNEIFGDGENLDNLQIPRDTSFSRKNSKYFTFLKDDESEINLLENSDNSESIIRQNLVSIDAGANSCDQLRVIRLIKHLYSFVEKQYFYKPSHLILLRYAQAHCKDEEPFFNQFFTDFIAFINTKPSYAADCLFPCKISSKKPKLVHLKLDDSTENAIEIERETFTEQNKLENSIVNSTREITPVIEDLMSDDSEFNISRMQKKGFNHYL